MVGISPPRGVSDSERARHARRARRALSHESLRVAVTGSGARAISRPRWAPRTFREVVANALAISRFYPQTRCAIELGGQDAKMIFFRTNDKGDIEVADMRMNGSCAGGTGAFIDEMAKLMGGRHRIGRVRAARKPGNDRPRGLGPLRRVRKDRYPAAAQRGHSYHRPGAFGASRGRPPNDRRSGPGYRHRAAGNLRGRYARLQPHTGPRVPGAN